MNLFFACGSKGSVDEVRQIIRDNPDIDVNAINICHETALFAACYYGHVEIVKLLINHPKINLNIKSISNITALWMACHWNHIEIIKYLLSSRIHEIDITITSSSGATAKQIAEREGNVVAFSIMQEYEADHIKTRNRLRRELYPEEESAHLFSMILLAHHEYLRLN